tara:strand:- start:1719 stop:1919 length:201 start_codon:yes stop_codon:yes gene_type:complete
LLSCYHSFGFIVGIGIFDGNIVIAAIRSAYNNQLPIATDLLNFIGVVLGVDLTNLKLTFRGMNYPY